MIDDPEQGKGAFFRSTASSESSQYIDIGTSSVIFLRRINLAFGAEPKALWPEASVRQPLLAILYVHCPRSALWVLAGGVLRGSELLSSHDAKEQPAECFRPISG